MLSIQNGRRLIAACRGRPAGLLLALTGQLFQIANRQRLFHGLLPYPFLVGGIGDSSQTLLLNADRDWLAARIAHRFDAMIDSGALNEVQANLASWDPALPSSKAIGAPELVDHLRGNRSLNAAIAGAKTATRQYAKRQRTWFRSKMREWASIQLP